MENGGAFSCAGISEVARPFFAALLAQLFPRRPIVVVTDVLKTQESFQQDLETWATIQSAGGRAAFSPLFYPAWEVLPHENKLPHSDNITDRLQVLVALANRAEISNPKPEIVVASITALLQKTFTPAELRARMRTLARGERLAPLDLVEWLEAQGYEPEAQVTQKGELALRGGILDLFPLTSPWPVRLEFFGDELESLRYFDPQTQISREEITAITLPPAGELGVLKSELERGEKTSLATLLDFLPNDTIFLLCEPELLAVRADEYAQQVGEDDRFFVSWENFRESASGKTFLELSDSEIGSPSPPRSGGEVVLGNRGNLNCLNQSPPPADWKSPAWTPIVHWPSGLWNHKLPRSSAANSSRNCIAGCGRITLSTFFAITMANNSAFQRYGMSLGALAFRPSKHRRFILARSRGVLSRMKRISSLSPTPKFSAATKSSARAA